MGHETLACANCITWWRLFLSLFYKLNFCHELITRTYHGMLPMWDHISCSLPKLHPPSSSSRRPEKSMISPAKSSSVTCFLLRFRQDKIWRKIKNNKECDNAYLKYKYNMLSAMQTIICLHNGRILKSLSHSNLKLEVNELFKKVRKKCCRL